MGLCSICIRDNVVFPQQLSNIVTPFTDELRVCETVPKLIQSNSTQLVKSN